MGRAIFALALRGLWAGAGLVATTAVALAFGPTNLEELRKTCSECVAAKPTEALEHAMASYEKGLSLALPGVQPQRLCYDLVKPLAGQAQLHHQHYCRVITPCGHMEVTHMHGGSRTEVFYQRSSLAGQCSEESAKVLRSTFLNTFLRCGSSVATKQTRVSIETHRNNYSAPLPTGADATQQILANMQAAELPDVCKAMYGSRSAVGAGDAAHEILFLAHRPQKRSSLR